MTAMLFHVSEEGGIGLFEPRPSPDWPEGVVWAIDSERLRNYLLPRDCPRVTYYAGVDTSRADVERFLGSNRAVVAIEEQWLARVRSCRLYCYHLPADTFECVDTFAGYFVSHVRVMPAHVEIIDDPLSELRRRDVDLRMVPNLRPLHDAVAVSSLQFSSIRLRNALPRLTE